MPKTDRFTFRKHASIGAAAAEEDKKILSACFVDNGDLEPLLDCADRRRLILGRTGTGKSALLARVAEEVDAIVINPETLSFNYLMNSTILQFFLEAGVKLDLFFKLLWRHVFTVELIRRRYNLTNHPTTQSFIERLQNKLGIGDEHKKRAMDYLLQWGDEFWQQTEYRIKDITRRIEEGLEGSIEGTPYVAKIRAGAAKKLTEEERGEVVQRGKTVINAIQMRELTDVLTFLNDDVFTDAQNPLYICIDRLDENWIDDSFRYLLIRSLIETIRDFLQVRHVKIIAVLRTDLIERVFKFTRDSGFQEEKYRSLYLTLRWTESQLLEVLDKRVNYLVRQTYTKQPVGYRDVLPGKMDRSAATGSYLINRTLMRPRDLIEFFNSIIEFATGKPTITKEMIRDGEGIYSKNRLRSLQDEWISDYPSVVDCAVLLKQRPNTFHLGSISREQIEEFCLTYSIGNSRHMRRDLLSVQARSVAEGIASWEAFLCVIVHVFYLAGIVGLKTEAHEAYQWSHQGPSTVVADTINLETSVRIHPMFYRVLGIKP